MFRTFLTGIAIAILHLCIPQARPKSGRVRNTPNENFQLSRDESNGVELNRVHTNMVKMNDFLTDLTETVCQVSQQCFTLPLSAECRRDANTTESIRSAGQCKSAGVRREKGT